MRVALFLLINWNYPLLYGKSLHTSFTILVKLNNLSENVNPPRSSATSIFRTQSLYIIINLKSDHLLLLLSTSKERFIGCGTNYYCRKGKVVVLLLYLQGKFWIWSTVYPSFEKSTNYVLCISNRTSVPNSPS